MKKLFLSTLTLVVSLLITSCSSDVEGTSEQRSATAVNVTGQIVGEHPTTRGYWTGSLNSTTDFYWENGDEVTLFNKSYRIAEPSNLTMASLVDNKPTWKGYANVITGEKVIAIYPTMREGGFLSSYNSLTAEINLDLTGQTTYKTRALYHDYSLLASDAIEATGNGELGTNLFYHFVNRVSFWEYRFFDEDGNKLNVKDVTISGVAVAGKYSIVTEKASYTQLGSLTYNNVNADSLFTVNLPGTYKNVTFTAHTTDGKVYVAKIETPLEFEENHTKVYNVHMSTGNVPPTPDEPCWQYYAWDAYAPFICGMQGFGPGRDGGNPRYGYRYRAEHSAKNCPTVQQVLTYMNAPIYYGRGVGKYARMNGLWLKKLDKVSCTRGAFSTYYYYGTYRYVSNRSRYGQPSRQEIDDYFFLPAIGYKVAPNRLVGFNCQVKYWTSETASCIDRDYILQACPTYCGVVVELVAVCRNQWGAGVWKAQ